VVVAAVVNYNYDYDVSNDDDDTSFITMISNSKAPVTAGI
jgi:predicted nucleic acid-binding protein